MVPPYAKAPVSAPARGVPAPGRPWDTTETAPGGTTMSRTHFQSVFITGASSGLGRGLALHYAREGATVHAGARRQAELESLAHDVAGAGAPGRIVPVVLDVADEEALVAALAAAGAAGGGGRGRALRH